jgi:RNA methyltransferase, TrmH family
MQRSDQRRERRSDFPPSSHPILDRISGLIHKRHRDLSGLHFVEGYRTVIQALEAGVSFETIIFSEVLCAHATAQKRVRLAKRAGVAVTRVSPEEFRRISRTPRASGLGAVLRQHWTPLERIDPRQGLCWLAVGLVRSPGNLGTILRTAEAVGAGGVLFLGESTDAFDPAVIRATLGGIFRLRLVRTSAGAFQEWARRHGCRVLALSPSATSLYTEAPLKAPLVIFLGEERQGLTPEERSLCTHAARIPILGRADSLNVGVAAGVMLYEVLRRRSPPSSRIAPSVGDEP